MIEFENHDIIIELPPEGRDGASVTARGEWEADEHYYYLDIVSYNGGSYLAKTDVPAGTLPTNDTYWQVVASNAHWGEITGDLSDQEDLQAALDAKADVDSVYTKTEADALLADKADKNSVYSKTEADALLAEKADASDVYTKTQVDDALDLKADKADSYTKDELDGIFDGIDNALDSKADADSVYTKAQTNTLLAAKANAADLGTMAGVNDAPSDGKEYARKNGQWAEVTGGISSVSWGDIDGTLSDQTDLKNALDAKANTADLGALADQDTVDYDTEVTNKPTLGTMSAESASDYYDKGEVNDLINASGVVAELDASGSIATFETNLAENLSRLSVSIDPVQDLHGYDNPWPAGGGKNLFGLKTIDSSERGYRIVATAGSSQYTISGTSSDNSRLMISDAVTLPAGTYCFSCKFTGTVTDGTAYLLALQINSAWTGYMLSFADGTYTNQRKSGEVILSESSTVQLSVACNVGCVIDGTVSEIQFETGSSATTWQPYSNICPISGHSSAVVTRTGKNLLPESTVSIGNPNPRTYSVRFDSTPLPVGTYSITYTKDYQIGNLQVVYTDGSALTIGNNNTFTATKPFNKIFFYMNQADYNDGKVVTFSDIQLELGSIASAYEPYQGTSITIALGDTYYGAQLDAVAGTLTVTHGIIDIGEDTNSATWTYESVNQRFTFKVNGMKSAPQRTLKLICSEYRTISTGGAFDINWDGVIYNNNNLEFCVLHNHNYTDAAAMKSACSGVMLVYPLATPTVITGLTPAQIQALIGLNNVWADTGDVAVSYFNNSTAEAITDVKQMIASTETSMTATRNYTSGSLIIVGPALLKATSNISSGAALVIGTNCVRTTLEEWILSLIA